MTTKYYEFTGPCQWAKVFKPDPEYHNFTIMLGLDDTALELFKQSGLKGKLKDEGDGFAWATFRRPVSKEIKGETQDFGPPVVTLDGQPFNQPIGNGSIVSCVVCVYDYEYNRKKGTGHRLMSVDIKNLIPYEGKGGSEAFSSASQPIRAVLPPA